MQKDQVTFELNDIELKARQGQMLIEVADENGVEIPRFCYHEKLSVSANCRMCLVEVEKAPKMLPACATPVAEGMKAWTASPKAIAAQKSVMEFLLINHPLDCPVCDQGGECDLQEIALGYGSDQPRYQEKKRIVKDKNYGSLVATEMTRCIHCTRCVRFGVEIAGIPEIGGTGRGDHMEIGTYVERALSSELSGNIIDLCPVGALLSKPFLFSARSWEMKSYPGVAPHDAVGSNIQIQTRNGEVMRVTPRQNESINEIWLSDRDRFSYLALSSKDRLTQPMVRNSAGTLVEVPWQEALEHVVKGLKMAAGHEVDGTVGALASPNSSVEEFYLLQKWVRGLGFSNVDYRLRQQDFSGQQDQQPPQLGLSLAEVEQQSTILILGANLRHEQPLLAHRVRKAALAGATVASVHPQSVEFNFDLNTAVVTDQLTPAVAAIAKAPEEKGRGADLATLSALTSHAVVEASHRSIAEALLSGDSSLVLLGGLAYRDSNQAVLYALASAIARMSGATFGVVTEGSNALGGLLAGAVPQHSVAGRPVELVGLDAGAMMKSPPRALLLMGVEASGDLPQGAVDAINGCEFVVSIAPFADQISTQKADVVLPMAAFTESSGTFINMAGVWQSFQGVVAPKGEARPGWKILRVLGTLSGLNGFEYESSAAVLAEVKAACGETEMRVSAWRGPNDWGESSAVVAEDVPLYRVDALSRRSAALQQSQLGLRSTDGETV
ncbi:MAG: NADH-quinone oxidoreductase subunit G [Gammaproteobacteria bacterium]|nr:NADH-quinone oxidoreductase subunit G [Gammaproteobacteria bacterium]